jgi:hypothetical protein
MLIRLLAIKRNFLVGARCLRPGFYLGGPDIAKTRELDVTNSLAKTKTQKFERYVLIQRVAVDGDVQTHLTHLFGHALELVRVTA